MSRRSLTLAATVLGSSLAFIDTSVVIVALPTIGRELELGLGGQQWVFLSYSLTLAALYLVGGAVGDRWSRRGAFAVGVVGFAAASALAGAAPSGELLIAARALQGVGGAFMTTNSLALLRSVYGADAGRAIGIWTAATSAATLAGPPLGGALVDWVSWRWIFYVNLPLAAVTLLLARAGVCRERQAQRIGRLDVVGALLAAVGFGAVTYGLVEGAESGFGGVAWSFPVAVVALGAFVWYEARAREPMLPLGLFRRRNFTVANAETFLVYGALYGVFVYVTIFLQFIGFSAFEAGLLLVPPSAALVLLAARFGALADRHGPRLYLVVAPALIGVSALLFLAVDDRGSFWRIGFAAILVFSLGLAILVAPITAAALKSAPTDHAGIASGVNSTVSRLGSLLAVAAIGLVISLVFRPESGVALAADQTGALREASLDAFRAGMLVVAALAFAGAATALAISNREALRRDETPAPQPAPARG